MVLVILLGVAADNAQGWTITSGFEDGTPGTNATGSDAFGGAGSDTKHSDERSFTGSQSAKFHFTECEEGWAKAHASYGYPSNVPYGGEIWARCYIYQKSPWSNGYCGPFTCGYWKFFRIRRKHSDDSHRGYTSIIGQHTGPFFMSNESCPVASIQQNVGSPYTLAVDQWECVEFYIKFHETEGIIRMWINGELKVERTNFQTSYEGDYANQTYVYTWWNDGAPQDQDSFMDDIVITTDTPSQQDSYGNYMIGSIGGPTPPGQASSPNPTNSATDIAVDADLSWTAGSGTTSHDVYFGTDSTPDSSELQGNQAATTYDPGTMANDTTYYWRIDEVNTEGTTTGTVWNFTTEAPGAGDVEVIGSWTSGTSHAEEAGSNRALIFIAHAESNADTSDLGSVTYGGQSMTRVVERNMHSSYSAYTCAFILDEAGIDDATSGTFSPSWNTSPSGTPAYTSVFLENVNQTTLTGATGNGGTTTTTAETSALSTNDGDMAIVAGTCGNDAAYSTINSFTEAIEVTPTSADGIGGYLAATGSNVTPGVSHTNVNRQSVIGFVVKAATGGPTPPGQASNPNPTNSATDISIDADLSWTEGADSTSSDVYFGTDPTPDSGEYMGNQAATTFEPGTLANDTTYYWRIDEVNTEGTTTGTVWSFTTIVTAPAQASNPNPANSATDVSVTADLSWTAGSGATSRNVYFGTTSPGTSQGNQTATSFDTGAMANDTTYYWRIDEVNAGGTTTGNVWNFTTIVAAPSQATNPSPTDSATDVDIDADLSWTAGSGSTSSDVYFGTTSPGTFQNNQTATTFDPGTLEYETAYYWRIDEVNAAATTTGIVWSFTTVESGGQVTEEFGDAVNTDYPGTIEDTFTNVGDPNANKSTMTELNTYTWPADTVANTTIIEWDLSSISTSATVIDATLYLYQVGTGGDTSYDIPVHKIVNVNPVISALTWNTYDGTNSWTGGSDGGQSDTAAAEDTPAVNSTNNQYKTWSVTNMVQDWVTTPANNYGMLLNSDDVASMDSHRTFASTEAVDSSTRPKLIVTYTTVSPPGQASNPNPADTAADVSITADLSWTAGEDADSHDVYLGTSSPGTFQGNQAETTFDPGTMANGTTYYWRIDEVNTEGTTTGTVWSFTTIVAAPGSATNPSPANSAANVSVTADLSWSAGSGATSHDVYFGTSSPGTFQGNQAETTFDTGTMANDTTYYWRIDEVNVAGTTTGNVWSFTTIVAAPAPATNPNPTNSATDISIDADLTWTAGSGATSHDVYFGTSSPGTFQGNQAATTFDPGTMDNDTTYYWRTDEVNVGGTTTGSVWSFTTEVAVPPPGQASNPSPADSATDVSIDADLSWTAGSGSDSSDVYFGTDSTPDSGEFMGNQPGTTFEPGTLENDTTYYWRIDEVNTSGTTTGVVWNFTTEAATIEEFGDAVNTDYPGTIEDTYTNAGSSGTNYSTDVDLNTYTWPADTVANTTIIKWDLSAIPTNAAVTEATLYLYQTDSYVDTSYDVPVHKITGVNPVISALTWNTYDGTNSWTGGGDGGQSDIAAAEDTHVANSTDNEYKTWSVTNMVQDWVTTPANNYGMLVNSDDVASVDSCRLFASTEVVDSSTRPKLIVTYTTVSPLGQASNPNPANSATDVSVDADLSWTEGSGSDSSDVYFGTTSPGTFQGNQTATTFEPGTLDYDTTFYWRIDEVNAGGTTTGTVWSFTTEAEPSEWTELTNDDFEAGWGSYTAGGNDCRRSASDSAWAHQGTYCVRIRDNSGDASALYYTNSIDVSSYSQIKVEFWYYPRSVEIAEDFFVEFWDGDSWEIIATYVMGTDFTNGSFYQITDTDLIIDSGTYNFPTDMQFKFRGDLADNGDMIYIDEIVISAK